MMIPATIHKKIKITIEEAYSGINYPLEIEREVFEEDGSIRREEEKIYINIPKGVDTNKMIIIKNKGNCNQMKRYGDIKVINFYRVQLELDRHLFCNLSENSWGEN